MYKRRTSPIFYIGLLQVFAAQKTGLKNKNG